MKNIPPGRHLSFGFGLCVSAGAITAMSEIAVLRAPTFLLRSNRIGRKKSVSRYNFARKMRTFARGLFRSGKKNDFFSAFGGKGVANGVYILETQTSAEGSRKVRKKFAILR